MNMTLHSRRQPTSPDDGDALTARIANWLGQIQSEYLERPRLHLTLSQAQLRFGLDELTSTALFDALVDVRFLRRTSTGAFVRADVH